MTELILLPGMMCDDRLFAPQIEALREKVDVNVMSLSGHNRIESLARAVITQAHNDTFALAGLSMGGIVAMEIIRQVPERVERLALLNTNHLSEPSAKREARELQIKRVLSGNLEKVLINEMKPLYLSPQHRQQDGILQTVLEMALDLGEDVFQSQSEALANRPDYTEALRNYSGKTLVLAGQHDALCPPERHRQIAALTPNATLEILADSGHLSTLECPQAVNQALINWLA